MSARGTTLAIAGMVAWDTEERIVSPEGFRFRAVSTSALNPPVLESTAL
jgi:hypothetical protein